MIIHGFQLRCARAACALTTRDVRDALGVSLTTLAKLEGMGELPIADTQRQKGTVERQLVEQLIGLYSEHGVRFLEARGDEGPGIRYQPPRDHGRPNKRKR
jgi:hypothetical protein